jgi:hypothetical protein
MTGLRLAATAMSALLLTACAHQPVQASEVVSTVAEPATLPTLNGRPSFNGVWVMAAYDLVYLPQEHDPPYNEQTRANMERLRTVFDPVIDDPAQYCVRMGMPWRMLNRARDYPVEIYQTDQRVIMLFEGHDDYRSIRLDRTTVPENLPALANGWSNAVWNGEQLLITTSNVTGRTEINPLQRSESAVITERWTLSRHPEHGEVIEIDITMVDPERYDGPIHARNVYKRAAPGIEVGGYNCADALWEEHLIRREEELAATQDGASE